MDNNEMMEIAKKYLNNIWRRKHMKEKRKVVIGGDHNHNYKKRRNIEKKNKEEFICTFSTSN